MSPWEKWQIHVLAELKRISHAQDRLQESQEKTLEQVMKHRVDLAILKVKSAVWGSAAGGAVMAIGQLVKSLKGGS